jgi:hypothetical protein
MRRIALLILAAAFAGGAAPVLAGGRPTVVELFTSQGCSSCPPADALLAELASRPDILALSFHVDYWDRLGWKDPFSSPQATTRQHRYAALLDLATVYTPQIVVDGHWQAVGSERGEIRHALAKAAADPVAIPLALAITGRQATARIGSGAGRETASLLLVGFDRRHVTAIKAGENGGRKLAYVDVVRSVRDLGRVSGETATADLADDWQGERIAALLQAEDGRILGAAVVDLPGS